MVGPAGVKGTKRTPKKMSGQEIRRVERKSDVLVRDSLLTEKSRKARLKEDRKARGRGCCCGRKGAMAAMGKSLGGKRGETQCLANRVERDYRFRRGWRKFKQELEEGGGG